MKLNFIAFLALSVVTTAAPALGAEESTVAEDQKMGTRKLQFDLEPEGRKVKDEEKTEEEDIDEEEVDIDIDIDIVEEEEEEVSKGAFGFGSRACKTSHLLSEFPG